MNYVANAPKFDLKAIYERFHSDMRVKWKESFRKRLPEVFKNDG